MGGAEGRLITVDTAQPERQAAGKMPLFAAAEASFPDGISSIAVHPPSGEIVVGTRKSDMYRVGLTGQVSSRFQAVKAAIGRLRHMKRDAACFRAACGSMCLAASYV